MMKIGDKVKSLIEGGELFYVGTSDKKGCVHLAVAEDLKVTGDRHVAFEDWFCYETLENLKANPHITIGVVDPRTKKGYQMIGEVERVNVGAILNGFVGQKEEEWSHYPQSKYQLYIRVDRIFELNIGPHSDEEMT